MKAVTLKQLRPRMLNTDEARQGYTDACKELAILALLAEMRTRAGFNKSELASRLGISPAALNKLEKKPLAASLTTLERYASACGATINIRVSYK